MHAEIKCIGSLNIDNQAIFYFGDGDGDNYYNITYSTDLSGELSLAFIPTVGSGETLAFTPAINVTGNPYSLHLFICFSANTTIYDKNNPANNTTKASLFAFAYLVDRSNNSIISRHYGRTVGGSFTGSVAFNEKNLHFGMYESDHTGNRYYFSGVNVWKNK